MTVPEYKCSAVEVSAGTDHALGVPFVGYCTKKKSPHLAMGGLQKKAAAYSPTWCGSTIGADGLNFPVRNGKGWAPSPWPPRSLPGSPGLNTLYVNDMVGTDAQHPFKRRNRVPQEPPERFRAKGANAQAYGQLVPLGCMHRCTSTCGLSTWSSPTAL